MFSPESTKLALDILQNEIPFAIWETVYVTIISTFLALVVGLPLGVLLVVGEKGGILPLPKPILSVLNAVINLLRSIPFLILMIMVFPVTRFFAHTVVGTVPTIVPLVFAAFPFVARLVESSIRLHLQQCLATLLCRELSVVVVSVKLRLTTVITVQRSL